MIVVTAVTMPKNNYSGWWVGMDIWQRLPVSPPAVSYGGCWLCCSVVAGQVVLKLVVRIILDVLLELLRKLCINPGQKFGSTCMMAPLHLSSATLLKYIPADRLDVRWCWLREAARSRVYRRRRW